MDPGEFLFARKFKSELDGLRMFSGTRGGRAFAEYDADDGHVLAFLYLGTLPKRDTIEEVREDVRALAKAHGLDPIHDTAEGDPK